MAAPPPQNGNGYGFHPYPGDYLFSHHGFPPPPPRQTPPVDLPVHPQNPSPYPPPAAASMAMMQPGGASHPVGQLPPSPVMHSPVRGPGPEAPSSDAKALRHIVATLGKMQNMMKDMADRQEQLLDRMSVLEQRVGRMDGLIGRMDEQIVRVDESVARVDEQLGRLDDQVDKVEEQCGDIHEQLGKTDDQVKVIEEQLLKTDESVLKVLDQVELTAQEAKRIRARVDDHESQEKRLAALMDGVVNKLVTTIGGEIKDVKKLVQDTEKHFKLDPLGWNRQQFIGQRYRDAMILNEEQQKEVKLS